MTTPRPGLRERKKLATRKALREAALRLALEHGPDNVRVDDIAEAAGVSPRTYNNYFSSREQAIVAAVTAEREARIAAAVAARPADVPLADAVIEAIVEQYTAPGSHEGDALLLITTRPALCEAFLRAAAEIEHPLAAAIAQPPAARPGPPAPARTPPRCSRRARQPRSASRSGDGWGLTPWPPLPAGSSCHPVRFPNSSGTPSPRSRRHSTPRKAIAATVAAA